jgi:RNA polymerase sigma-70 factor (ECF subfamily)
MAGTARLRQKRGGFDLQLVHVNGQPGRVLRTEERAIWDVLAVDVADGRITTVRIVRNPDKLAHL